jgi:hypothetical protein
MSIFGPQCLHPIDPGGRGGRDRMVVGFTTTCAISAYIAITTKVVS